LAYKRLGPYPAFGKFSSRLNEGTVLNNGSWPNNGTRPDKNVLSNPAGRAQNGRRRDMGMASHPNTWTDFIGSHAVYCQGGGDPLPEA
jgi:hypothetical protein